MRGRRACIAYLEDGEHHMLRRIAVHALLGAVLVVHMVKGEPEYYAEACQSEIHVGMKRHCGHIGYY